MIVDDMVHVEFRGAQGAGIFMIAIRLDILTMRTRGRNNTMGSSDRHSLALWQPLFRGLWRFVSRETQYPCYSAKRLVALTLGR